MSLKFTKSDHKDKNFAVSSHCSYNLHYQIVFKSRLWTNCKAIFHYDKFMWVLCFTRFVNVATNTTTRSFIASRKKKSSSGRTTFFFGKNKSPSLSISQLGRYFSPFFPTFKRIWKEREKKACHWLIFSHFYLSLVKLCHSISEQVSSPNDDLWELNDVKNWHDAATLVQRIGCPQCGNFWIFLSFRFDMYVK